MKKIKTCRNSDILVLLMAVGIILVLLAYRISVRRGHVCLVDGAAGAAHGGDGRRRLPDGVSVVEKASISARPPGGAVSQNHFFHLKISSSSTTHSALAIQTIR